MKCNSASVKDVVLLQWQKLSVSRQRVSQLFILFSMKEAGVRFSMCLKLCVARERPQLITCQYSCKMSRFPISELKKNTQLKGNRSWLEFKLSVQPKFSKQQFHFGCSTVFCFTRTSHEKKKKNPQLFAFRTKRTLVSKTTQLNQQPMELHTTVNHMKYFYSGQNNTEPPATSCGVNSKTGNQSVSRTVK